MTLVVMPHWSASRFMAFDICPGEFKARYVDERPFEMTGAVAFGQAVHMGLEAHYRGDDAIRAFRAAWKAIVEEYLLDVDRGLTRMGMDLIEQVQGLGLSGIPERGFSIDTNAELGAPTVGAVDLWGTDGTIYDFKTSRGLWSQERAQKEVWQPLLYTWARWLEEPEYVADFEYIVLNRATGGLQRFRRAWTPDEWVEQWNVAQQRARAVSEAVRAGRFECHGKHGFCPECGARWSHEHVCDQTTERIHLHG